MGVPGAVVYMYQSEGTFFHFPHDDGEGSVIIEIGGVAQEAGQVGIRQGG